VYGREQPVHVLSTFDELQDARQPVLLWIGATCFVGADLESGLGGAAGWCAEHAPGVLEEPDYPDGVDAHGRCPECTDEHEGLSGPCVHVEDAEAGLTYVDDGLWIRSEQWGCSPTTPDILRDILAHLMERELFEMEHHHIVRELRDIRSDARDARARCVCAHDDACDYSEVHIDVRLQVYPALTWSFRCGDPSYDQDHGGWLGCGTVGPDDTVDVLSALADALISQAVEQFAQSYDMEDDR